MRIDSCRKNWASYESSSAGVINDVNEETYRICELRVSFEHLVILLEAVEKDRHVVQETRAEGDLIIYQRLEPSTDLIHVSDELL
jgi:hypothetical protein